MQQSNRVTMYTGAGRIIFKTVDAFNTCSLFTILQQVKSLFNFINLIQRQMKRQMGGVKDSGEYIQVSHPIV